MMHARQRKQLLALTLVTIASLMGCQERKISSSAQAPAMALMGEPEQIGAAQPDPILEPAPEAKPGPKHYYSPFALRLQNSDEFRVVTFKDVGLSKRQDGPDAYMLESLAEALKMSLANHQSLQLRSEVFFDKALTDPKNHRSCGYKHLYVDVWRSESPARIGYSLWSGCGESDNFAWKELELSQNAKTDPQTAVLDVSKSIVQTLSKASAKGCYQREC